MLYLSGIHALNLPCELDTCGDWHTLAIQWDRLNLLESEGSVFGNYGIERDKTIPGHYGTETYNVANHIRALLDLLTQSNFSEAQGMNRDFICNDSYNDEVFQKVSMLSSAENWREIDHFMGKEYLSKWLDYKEGRGG